MTLHYRRRGALINDPEDQHLALMELQWFRNQVKTIPHAAPWERMMIKLNKLEKEWLRYSEEYDWSTRFEVNSDDEVVERDETSYCRPKMSYQTFALTMGYGDWLPTSDDDDYVEPQSPMGGAANPMSGAPESPDLGSRRTYGEPPIPPLRYQDGRVHDVAGPSDLPRPAGGLVPPTPAPLFRAMWRPTILPCEEARAMALARMMRRSPRSFGSSPGSDSRD